MFASKEMVRPRFDNNRVLKLTLKDSNYLESPFTEKEVWEAVCGCGNDKSPSPDGFNFKYIKRFWDIFKRDIMDAVSRFWDKGMFSKGCNASFVMLIPKVTYPMGLGDFRPISLIVQNAFIEGRYILDSVLIANEAMKYMRKKKRKGVIFKVDFKKAYDSIEWDYLLEIMRKTGFGNRWGNGLMLVAEGLNVLIKEAVARDIFKGWQIGNDGVMVSLLQYIDDIVIFGEWNRVNAKNLMCILKCFEEVVELKINLNKSKLYDVGVEKVELEGMARFVGCGVGEFPFTYLGLPIGLNIRRASAWNRLLKGLKIGFLSGRHMRCCLGEDGHW
ncbi:kinase-like domain, beta-lactamase/transpeptidase-like protein [Tanacetum coccineum]